MWAVGQGGQYVHYDGKNYDVGTSASVSDLHALWLHSPDDVWAAGQAGVVQRWSRDSGWAKIASTPATTLNGIWGRDEKDVWAVASTNAIFHFDGSVWKSVSGPAGTAQTLNALTGTAAGELWAVGVAGTIVHYDGESWEREATRIGSDLLGVTVGTDGELWAVGKKQFVFRRRP
jgi:hypothetical protein